MKIAMMTNNYMPFIGGVSISINRLSESLRSMGHEVVVFAPEYKNTEETQTTVRYRSLIQGVACGFSIPNSFDPRIEKRFREGDFDVIHVHHPMLIGKTARYLSWKYKVPLVFTYHTRYEQYLHYIGLSSLKGIIPYYIKEFTGSCDMVIAPTPLMKNYLENIPINTPIAVLPTGITEESFQPEEDRVREIRAQLLGNADTYKNSKTYLFCCVARLAKEKNIEFLLKSLSVRKKSHGSDFKIALIGEGPEKENLEKTVRKLSMQEEVIFVGKVPNEEIKNYCAASDLFLFASTSETQGIVLLEAMAAGTPVLAVRATGTEDIVENGRNGYMTEEREEDFALKLMDMLNKKEQESLIPGAYETACAYTAKEIAQRAILYYTAAIYKKREKEKYKENAKYGILSRVVSH